VVGRNVGQEDGLKRVIVLVRELDPACLYFDAEHTRSVRVLKVVPARVKPVSLYAYPVRHAATVRTLLVNPRGFCLLALLKSATKVTQFAISL